MAHSKATWAKLKAAYRRGEGSIAAIAPRYGIPAATAERRCTVEKWRVARRETAEKAEARAAEKDVEQLADMLGRHRGLASRLLRLVEKKLDEAEQGAAEPAVDEMGFPIDPLSANRLNTFSEMVTRLVPVERLAAGIEPSKPVTPVQQATRMGVSILVRRTRNPAVPKPAGAGA